MTFESFPAAPLQLLPISCVSRSKSTLDPDSTPRLGAVLMGLPMRTLLSLSRLPNSYHTGLVDSPAR
eukprot:XP_001698434.1 predicted protein [Chlamydomonas reinhardtii]